MFTPERHLPTPGQHGHSPQRHTAAGTAAPTTTDTGNTVPQRANPTQTAYAHPRRRAQAQGQRLGTWTLWSVHKRSRCAYSTQWYPREIGTLTITVSDVWAARRLSASAVTWPSQDIRLCQRFCKQVNHPFIGPPTCNAHTVAIFLHDCCAR